MRILLFVLLLCVATAADAANRYVRQGATGSGSGADWTDAYTNLPATLVRGDTYYVADGSYGDYRLDDTGTTTITIKKATAADHGTDTGWLSTYGDGQAVWGTFTCVQSNYTIDGATRNESNWQQVSSYGFRVSDVLAHTTNEGSISDNMIFRYCDVGGNADGVPCSTGDGGSGSTGFYAGFSGLQNWTISRCHIHDVELPFIAVDADGWTVEYSHIGPSWAKEAISGQQCENWTIRWCKFVDNLIFPPAACQHGGDGGTADIWTRNQTGQNDGWQIYGNVFADTGTYPNIVRTNAVVQGNFYSGGGDGVSNWLVYHNSFYNITQMQGIVRVGDGSGNIARNNLWYKVQDGSTVTGAVNFNTTGKSWCYRVLSGSCGSAGTILVGNEDPFVDAANMDFRLKSSFTGVSPLNQADALTAPYNVDANGIAHNHIGAFASINDGGQVGSPGARKVGRGRGGVMGAGAAP